MARRKMPDGRPGGHALQSIGLERGNVFAKRTEWNLEANRLSEALARHRAAGKPLLDLTVSNPTACGFEYDKDEILRALQNPAALTYQPDPRGLESARRAVAAYYGERDVDVPAEAVILTTGTSEAYSFVLRLLCDPGDEVLVPEPSYPLLGFLADIEDVTLVPYPLVYNDGWRMDFPALEQAITPRTRAAVVVHPNNPTGHYCRPEDARRLAELCAGRGMAVLSDEVFLDFALDGPRPGSFASNREALTFTLSGLSKIAGLPQMKAAWMVVSGPELASRVGVDVRTLRRYLITPTTSRAAACVSMSCRPSARLSPRPGAIAEASAAKRASSACRRSSFARRRSLASRRVIVSAEEIVSTDEFRRDPARTSIPHFAVDAVVHAPFGAYPGTVQGYYASDPEGVVEAMGAMFRGDFKDYLQKHVYSVGSHEEYLQKAVGTKRIAEIRRRETIREGYGV